MSSPQAGGDSESVKDILVRQSLQHGLNDAHLTTQIPQNRSNIRRQSSSTPLCVCVLQIDIYTNRELSSVYSLLLSAQCLDGWKTHAYKCTLHPLLLTGGGKSKCDGRREKYTLAPCITPLMALMKHCVYHTVIFTSTVHHAQTHWSTLVW